MKKKILFIFFISETLIAQVGVNTTDPKSQLEIKASSTTSPVNTDGILIPRMSAFPAGVGANQNGMLIYLTAAVGSKSIGFYYWDNSTSTWLGLYSNASTTNDISVTNFEDFVFDEYAGAGGPTTGGKNDNQYSFSPVITGLNAISNVDGTSALFDTYSPSGTGGNDYIGVHHLSTGTTNSGRAGLGSSDFGNRMKIGGKEIVYELRVKFPVTLASGQNYTAYLGLNDLGATTSTNFSLASTITNGVYFRYTVVGTTGTFVGVSNKASTTTTITSSTAINTNTWYKFKVIIAVGGAADFYIDDVKFGTIASANLPTAPMKFVFLIEKNGVGTTASTCNIDYISWRMVR